MPVVTVSCTDHARAKLAGVEIYRAFNDANFYGDLSMGAIFAGLECDADPLQIFALSIGDVVMVRTQATCYRSRNLLVVLLPDSNGIIPCEKSVGLDFYCTMTLRGTPVADAMEFVKIWRRTDVRQRCFLPPVAKYF